MLVLFFFKSQKKSHLFFSFFSFFLEYSSKIFRRDTHIFYFEIKVVSVENRFSRLIFKVKIEKFIKFLTFSAPFLMKMKLFCSIFDKNGAYLLKELF